MVRCYAHQTTGIETRAELYAQADRVDADVQRVHARVWQAHADARRALLLPCGVWVLPL